MTPVKVSSISGGAERLLDVANAVAGVHRSESDPLLPLTIAKEWPEETWRAVVASLEKQSGLRRHAALPWDHEDVNPEMRLHGAQAYLSAAFTRVDHLVNIEDAHAIDRRTLIVLRRILETSPRLTLLLEYTTNAQWPAWTAEELETFVAHGNKVRVQQVALAPVTQGEAANILNEKLSDAGITEKVSSAGPNLRVGEVILQAMKDPQVRANYLLDYATHEPEAYLDHLSPGQKAILSVIALFGPEISSDRLSAVLHRLPDLGPESVAPKADVKQLLARGLLHKELIERRDYLRFVHDFDRLTVINRSTFNEARRAACKPLADVLREEQADVFRRIHQPRKNGTLSSDVAVTPLWGGYWNMLLVLGRWDELKEDVIKVLRSPRLLAFGDVARALNQLNTLLRSESFKGSKNPAFSELRRMVGWFTVDHLYRTMQFDEAMQLAEKLEGDGPRETLLRCSLESMTGKTERAIEMIDAALETADDYGLEEPFRVGYRLQLMTAKAQNYLECWNLQDYQQVYDTVHAGLLNHAREHRRPGVSSFLRLTRPELRGRDGLPLSPAEVRTRLDEAIRLLDEGGPPLMQEAAATRVTYAQVIGDMATADGALLADAERLLKEAAEIAQRVAFDRHSIPINRAGIALIRHGLGAEEAVDLNAAVIHSREAMRDCDYPYGELMILSNMALAEAFLDRPKHVVAIDDHVRQIHKSRCIKDVDMRRRGWINTGFALAWCHASQVPDREARVAYYLHALAEEGLPDDNINWPLLYRNLEAARDSLLPSHPVVGEHYLPTLMAYWHPFVERDLPWQFS